MHTQFNTTLARQLVADRLREAETTRLAREVRRQRKSSRADGTGTTEQTTGRALHSRRLWPSYLLGTR